MAWSELHAEDDERLRLSEEASFCVRPSNEALHEAACLKAAGNAARFIRKQSNGDDLDFDVVSFFFFYL
jgi:hypothetical protein